MDLEEQYDKIYRYCYFKVHHRETAEDITQETFLRFFESKGYRNTGQALHYLYTIARNLCIDEYRRRPTEPFDEAAAARGIAEDGLTEQVAVRIALSELAEDERELLLLRYANDVPVSVLSKLLGISRFAVYRRLLRVSEKLKEKLGEEDSYGQEAENRGKESV